MKKYFNTSEERKNWDEMVINIEVSFEELVNILNKKNISFKINAKGNWLLRGRLTNFCELCWAAITDWKHGDAIPLINPVLKSA